MRTLPPPSLWTRESTTAKCKPFIIFFKNFEAFGQFRKYDLSDDICVSFRIRQGPEQHLEQEGHAPVGVFRTAEKKHSESYFWRVMRLWKMLQLKEKQFLKN